MRWKNWWDTQWNIPFRYYQGHAAEHRDIHSIRFVYNVSIINQLKSRNTYITVTSSSQTIDVSIVYPTVCSVTDQRNNHCFCLGTCSIPNHYFNHGSRISNKQNFIWHLNQNIKIPLHKTHLRIMSSKPWFPPFFSGRNVFSRGNLHSLELPCGR